MNNSPSVLIIDDTPMNLRLLVSILSEPGYAVRPARSGALGLASAQASPPDIILLDIRMPEMNGFEVCQQLKANAQTQDIPVIFISALDAAEDKVNAFQVGGVDYITKPFQPKEVIARIKMHLKMRTMQEQIEQTNRELAQRVSELEAALEQIKTLEGLLPICANCKKIRDDTGTWHQVEFYVQAHSKAEFSHGICPECMAKLYPDFTD